MLRRLFNTIYAFEIFSALLFSVSFLFLSEGTFFALPNWFIVLILGWWFTAPFPAIGMCVLNEVFNIRERKLAVITLGISFFSALVPLAGCSVSAGSYGCVASDLFEMFYTYQMFLSSPGGLWIVWGVAFPFLDLSLGSDDTPTSGFIFTVCGTVVLYLVALVVWVWLPRVVTDFVRQKLVTE